MIPPGQARGAKGEPGPAAVLVADQLPIWIRYVVPLIPIFVVYALAGVKTVIEVLERYRERLPSAARIISELLRRIDRVLALKCRVFRGRVATACRAMARCIS